MMHTGSMFVFLLSVRKFVADFWSFPHGSAWCYIMLHGFCFPWPGEVAVGPCYRFDSRTTFRQWSLESESYPQQVLQWYTQGGSDFTLIQSRSVFHSEIGLEDAIGCLRTWFVPRATTGRKLCRSCRLFLAWTWQTTSSVPRTPAASALQRLMGKWSRQVYLGMKLVDLPWFADLPFEQFWTYSNLIWFHVEGGVWSSRNLSLHFVVTDGYGMLRSPGSNMARAANRKWYVD